MPYWERPFSTSSPTLDTVSLASGLKHHKGNTSADAFYEIEPGIVLDIILDKNHDYFKSLKFKLTPDEWPVDVNKTKALPSDPNLTWVGRILVRLMHTQRHIEKEDCIWAIPLESNISEFPLLNEIVEIFFYLGQYYYRRKLNTFNIPNANANFNEEISRGGFRQSTKQDTNLDYSSLAINQGNRELLIHDSDIKKPFVGPLSKLNPLGSLGYAGALGRYFLYNSRIRALKHREGDLIVESRFGQSIRFSAYDDIRTNDSGHNSDFNGYDDYKGTGVTNPYSNVEAGGGNPMILIRNRQRPIAGEGKSIKVYDNPNIPPIVGTAEEKNVGGYIVEDINNDGSSIYLTSGVTISGFKTNCYKKIWGMGEEQSGFNGTTNFIYPKLLGDQIVINSDRMIISAKKSEMFQFAKKRMSFVTDDELTIDAHNQIVITTNNKTVINSPAIYLGEYNQTGEPALLGQTTVNWLYDLSNLLIHHTHWFNHVHPDAQGGTTGGAKEITTQIPVQWASFQVLRDKLNMLLSRRVFITGGGFAPGVNGGTIPNGAAPVTISIPSGAGVPGGWHGKNRR